ncbi:PDC sensor domain-containing protein [Loktanella salsilacus]|uniref:PDC sensor domain-containing protein n=1 Tax=Loktanella salsilacus TaxID=195913 RepID=UPI0037366974
MKSYYPIVAICLMTSAVPAIADGADYAAFVETQVAALAGNALVQDALAASSAAHSSYTMTEILTLDAEWRDQIDNADKPVIAPVIDAPVSAFLRQIVSDSGGSIVEVILMDQFGLNVGTSSITSDFWQGDEDKFRQTYARGIGSIHASDVSLDESTGMYVVQVAFPVLDADGQMVGAASFSLDAEQL